METIRHEWWAVCRETPHEGRARFEGWYGKARWPSGSREPDRDKGIHRNPERQCEKTDVLEKELAWRDRDRGEPEFRDDHAGGCNHETDSGDEQAR